MTSVAELSAVARRKAPVANGTPVSSSSVPTPPSACVVPGPPMSMMRASDASNLNVRPASVSPFVICHPAPAWNATSAFTVTPLSVPALFESPQFGEPTTRSSRPVAAIVPPVMSPAPSPRARQARC